MWTGRMCEGKRYEREVDRSSEAISLDVFSRDFFLIFRLQRADWQQASLVRYWLPKMEEGRQIKSP